MSSIKMLLDKLHVLAFGLGDSHVYEFESTKSTEDSREEEDTPAVAVARSFGVEKTSDQEDRWMSSHSKRTMECTDTLSIFLQTSNC